MVMTTSPTEASTYTGSSNLLFKKTYNGLAPPLANELGGTCHVGQLITDGVAQETRNGEGVRERYVCNDASLCLFPEADAFLSSRESNSTRETGGISRDEIYFRGDDQQRTLMSGQLLAEALFNTTEDLTGVENVLVDWHTADYSRDPIYPNSKICPRLKELEGEAKLSNEFIATNSSKEAEEMSRIMEEDWGGADWHHSE